ncbi:MAG: hypothetical protein MRJ65_12020 [Candidatus Brocadiaceae bacterium]|nr:hypothetical protein [Candidatus Brocadiaceae bacterium]
MFKNNETKAHLKERDVLPKFLVIISIEACLEALIFIFDTGKKDIRMLIYSIFLLIAACFVGNQFRRYLY